MAVVTKNAIPQMRGSQKKEPTLLIVQVINIKLIGTNRYRAIISDGEYFDQSFIGGSCQHYFLNSMVRLYQLIKIKDYSITEINAGAIITLQDIEPSTCLNSKYGSPIKYEPSDPSTLRPESSNHAASKPYNSGFKENLEFTSVKTLTSNSKDFMIKARVTKKTQMKEWKNERGAGKLFNINIIDSYNEEISMTFFKEEADKFYEMLQPGKVYVFKNGQVKISNKKFQMVDCEYSIIVDKRTEIVQTVDESEISIIKLSTSTIESIASMEPNCLVDVCAGVIDIGELSEVLSKKTGNVMKKRVLKLIDSSNATIELTLWNDDAVNNIFTYPMLPIMLVGKGLRVGSFNGVSLSTDRDCSQIIYNPDLPQVKSLKNWLSRNQNHSTARVLSMRGSISADKEYKSLLEIKQESEISDREVSYLVNACIGYIRSDPGLMFYQSCKNSGKCNKKVMKDSNGFYRCESCNESFEECEFKFLLNIKLQDFSESIWATVFDGVAAPLIGSSATSLHNKYIENIEEFDEVIQRACMKRIEGVIKSRTYETATGRKQNYVLHSAKFADCGKSLKRNLGIIGEYLSKSK